MLSENQNFETSPEDGSQQPSTIYNALQSSTYTQLNNPHVFSTPTQPPSLPNPQPVLDNSMAIQALNYLLQTGQLQGMPTPETPLSTINQDLQGNVTKSGCARTKRKAPRKGKGSRSGANSRDAGASDAEIEVLDERTKAQADITVPQRLRAGWDLESAVKLVEFITAPEQWKNITTSLTKICQEASQKVFECKYTTEQCINKWQTEFRTYKAAKRLMSHTGGGDGDEVSDLSDGEGGKGDGSSTIKKEEQPTTLRDGRKFSSTKLNNFIEGPIFPLIDAVADGRADINRSVEFSSHRKPEDVDKDVRLASRKRKKTDDDDFDTILVDAVRVVKDQFTATKLREEEHFAYQKLKDEREERLREEQLCIEKEKIEREAAIAASREKRERDDHRIKKIQFYQRMRDSADPLERALAVKLGEEIRQEEGL